MFIEYLDYECIKKENDNGNYYMYIFKVWENSKIYTLSKHKKRLPWKWLIELFAFVNKEKWLVDWRFGKKVKLREEKNFWYMEKMISWWKFI